MNLAQAIVESRPKAQDAIKPRWATVTSTSPLRIRFDGEDNQLNLKPVDLVGVNVNDRVWCQLYAGQVFIIGIKGGLTNAFGIMHKTDGFQSNSASGVAINMDWQNAVLMGGMGSQAAGGYGELQIQKSAWYQVDAMLYMTGGSLGVNRMAVRRWRGGFSNVATVAYNHTNAAIDEQVYMSKPIYFQAGDNVGLVMYGPTDTWGNSGLGGTFLSIREL